VKRLADAFRKAPAHLCLPSYLSPAAWRARR
jgi:hypothetical protein